MDLSIDIPSGPISEDAPCGDALDYDLDFLELEIAARYRPGQEIGDATIPPEPPDWQEVKRLTTALTQRSKDLRLYILAARASLHFDGLAGFSDALEQLATAVEQFWSEIHPRPDPEDEGEQLTRVNALAELCDPEGVVGELRLVPLAKTRGHGQVNLLDWLDTQRARGDASGTGVADRAAIENSFREMPIETLGLLADHIETSIASLTRIDRVIAAQIGDGIGIRFQPLAETLATMLRLVNDNRPVPIEVEAPTQEQAAMPRGSVISDRNDIIAMLDQICRWYRANEPASPVPALLDRASRLVEKDFMSLLLELAPAGAVQFQSLVGLSDRPQ